MKHAKETTRLIFKCLIIGIKHAFRYGWLAAHTYWVVERSRGRSKVIELACESQARVLFDQMKTTSSLDGE